VLEKKKTTRNYRVAKKRPGTKLGGLDTKKNRSGRGLRKMGERYDWHAEKAGPEKV